ncbi:hypothetical protein [Haloarcula salinisoli]|uniref:hypothetical protein n=1 Tax=Haloarcula salinisoli TaxID=2487746 RepID=UPI001C738349|nr:hypothetical protein [Halomicroarcula salinisoli]
MSVSREVPRGTGFAEPDATDIWGIGPVVNHSDGLTLVDGLTERKALKICTKDVDMLGNFAGLLALLFSTVLQISLTLWVYRDAEKHNPATQFDWAFVTLFTGPIGFYVYYSIGRNIAEQTDAP